LRRPLPETNEQEEGEEDDKIKTLPKTEVTVHVKRNEIEQINDFLRSSYSSSSSSSSSSS